MRVIAIDPGYDRVGVAILEKALPNRSSKEKLVYSACVTSKRDDTYYGRLHGVGTIINNLIEKYKPDAMALEKVYFNTNQKTALAVSEARGMFIYIATASKLKIYEYTPPQVKAAVTGSGRASKYQVSQMIDRLVDIPTPPENDDEYDAIAVGITCLAFVK